MSNLSPEKVKQALETIESALLKHNKWYENLLRSLLCRIPMDESYIAKDAHHKCEFGCWFYSNKGTSFGSLPSFTKIGELHKSMHDSAREICLKIKTNGLVNEDEYDYFNRSLSQFREELTVFKKRILDTLAHVSK